MTQVITIQVGQCGNQVGQRFWDLALREHSSVNKKGVYDSAMSTFFQNGVPSSTALGSMKQKVQSLKARAVLVDMEEGVVSEIMKGPLRNLFDHRQLITDVSGSGNNWAVGHCQYGAQYREHILESVRRAAEQCDCLQCFFILHSMGGGTGSGVGSFVSQMLQDEFPEVYRFVTAVFPSPDDDVVTSPYNSVLALHTLTDAADCVLPIDNQSLGNIIAKIQASMSKSSTVANIINSAGGVTKASEAKPFDAMNNIVANMLLNLTSSSRFEGTMNVDLNEITMNLVPFPRLHYLIAAPSPLCTSPEISLPPRKLDQMFTDSFTKDHQLILADPRSHTYLACALLLRGQVDVSDIRRNISKMQRHLKFVPWNEDGWKVGHCNVPPSGQKYALLNVGNNTCINKTWDDLLQRFHQLYRRKAHIHHYTSVDGFNTAAFDEAVESLVNLRCEYAAIDSQFANRGEAETLAQRTERLKIAF